GVRKQFLVPQERAGIGVGLPARFEAEHIAWDVVLTKRLGERGGFGGGKVVIAPIGDAQAPKGGNGAAAGEEVVMTYRIQRRWAGDDVNVDPLRRGNLRQHAAMAPIGIAL